MKLHAFKFCLTVLVFTGCAEESTDLPPAKPHSNISQDGTKTFTNEYLQIIDVVVRDQISGLTGEEFTVLESETVRRDIVQRELSDTWFNRHLTDADKNLLKTLNEQNRKSVGLQDRFTGLRVKLAPRKDIETIFPVFDADTWQQFYTRFPNAVNLLRLSRPAIAQSGDKAVIYVSWHADVLAAEATLVFLEKKGDKWEIVKDLLLWVS